MDDQPWNVRLLEHTLRRGGYTEISSTNDPRAVAALHLENRYALILLDLQMPGMNGFEVMKQLRAMEGDHVPILVISADPSQMVVALEGGGDSFLSKPFVLAEVLSRVGKMLQNTGIPILDEKKDEKGVSEKSGKGVSEKGVKPQVTS